MHLRGNETVSTSIAEAPKCAPHEPYHAAMTITELRTCWCRLQIRNVRSVAVTRQKVWSQRRYGQAFGHERTWCSEGVACGALESAEAV